MKNKKIILNLLISFVMVFVVAFGFGLKSSLSRANALPAQEEETPKITFRPVVEHKREYILPTEEAVFGKVVVTYYVTGNDGVNAFTLIPSYDKNVFSLLGENDVPQVEVGGGIDDEAVTVTGNAGWENQEEFVKIVYDSEELYKNYHAYSEGSEDNVALLTLTFSVKHPTVYGHYRDYFGLITTGVGENKNSVAYRDYPQDSIKYGDQEEVQIVLDVDDPNEVSSPENAIDIYYRQNATLETSAESYTYTYKKVAMPVTDKTGSDYTEDLQYGVEYKYTGNAVVSKSWQKLVEDQNEPGSYVADGDPFVAAPQNAGIYRLTLSAPASDSYFAVGPVNVIVVIQQRVVTITIANQSKVYGADPISFAGNFGVSVQSDLYSVVGSEAGKGENKDSITFKLSSDVIKNSNVNTYPITATNLTVADGNEGKNYSVTVNSGTYNVSKYAIKIFYGYQAVTFNGGTKSSYSVTSQFNVGENDDYATELTEDIKKLLGTYTHSGTINFNNFGENDIIPVNNLEDENDCYVVTPSITLSSLASGNFEVHPVPSDFRINQLEVTLQAANVTGVTFNGGDKSQYAAPTVYYVYVYNTQTEVSDALKTQLGVTLSVTFKNYDDGVVVNAGSYPITPSYNNANFNVHTQNGSYIISPKALTDEEYAEIRALFGIVEVTYDGKGHQMYTCTDGNLSLLGITRSGYDYVAKINSAIAENKTNAGTYPVTIDFVITDSTVNNNRYNYANGTEELHITYSFPVQVVISENETKVSHIDKKAFTVPTKVAGHTYGSYNTPFSTSEQFATGVKEEKVTVNYVVKDGNENVSLANNTPFGEYTIVTTAVENSNYVFACNDGTYTVSQALVRDVDGEVGPDDADPDAQTHAVGVKISVSGQNHIYNRANVVSHTVMVGNLTLTEGEDYTVVVTNSSNAAVDPEDVLNVGTYTITVTVTGNDNYVGATKSATFKISAIKLAAPALAVNPYNKGRVTWQAVTTDVEEVALVGSPVKYVVTYNELNELEELVAVNYDCGSTTHYDATATGAHTLKAVSTSQNYLDSDSIPLLSVYSVVFTDDTDNHAGNPVELQVPATQYLFEGQAAEKPVYAPVITGYQFADTWNNGSAVYEFSSSVNSNLTLVANWNALPYYVTVNYIATDPYQATTGARYKEGTRIYKEVEQAPYYQFTLEYNEKVGATLANDGNGNVISEYIDGSKVVAYEYQGKYNSAVEGNYYGNIYRLIGWNYQVGESQAEFKSIGELANTNITSDCALTAVYQVVDHLSFEIRYHVIVDGDVNNDKEYNFDLQSNFVKYTTEQGSGEGNFAYASLSTNVRWFRALSWYDGANRLTAAPATSVMPNHDIDVYGFIEFNVGLGDVNGNGSVDTNDITLYRQWIVGGYSMVVLETEGDNAVDYYKFASTHNFANDPEGTRYYLKRVADNNKDENRDIRDVSVTRMAIVGGYTWNIESHLNVTGEEITRSDRPSNLEALESSLESGKKVRLVQSLSDNEADLVISSDKDMYLDLAGYTLTVKSFSISSNANVTITIFNGTIVTTNGITISAPNGSVVLQDLDGYDANGTVNLAAFNHSLHINKNVKFIVGAPAEEQQQEQQQPAPVVLAPVNIAKGTHVVIEQAAILEVAKVVVVEVSVDQTSEQPTTFAPIANPTQADFITLDNYSVEVDVAEDLVFEGNVVDNSEISTLDQLKEAAKNGGTYKLVADIASQSDLYVRKDLTLDLTTHTITFAGWGFEVTNGATFTLNGTTGGITSVEATLYATYASKLVVNGGHYTATENFIVGTNGTVKANDDRGHNTITINGGVFNASMSEDGRAAGYTACGVYVANNDTFTITGGTFNVENGVGILARSGNTIVGENVKLYVTGNGVAGKIGDSRVVLPSGAELVLDYAANYPGGDPTLTNNSSYGICAVVESEEELNAVKSYASRIVLAKNIELSNYVLISRDLTLDLNGKTVTAANGFAFVASGAETDVTITGNGTVNALASALYVQNGAKLVVENGTYVSTSANTFVSTSGGTLTVNNATVTAQEVAVLVTSASTAVINGGTFTTVDNFVVGTNGSNGQGGNTITINGGVFNGGITSNGYIACGVYVANSDTVVLNAGTFNITNGVGMVIRAGQTTVKEAVVFNFAPNPTLAEGWVGDDKTKLPVGYAFVLDLAAQYPGLNELEFSFENETEYPVYRFERVSTLAELQAAAEKGGTYTLAADIEDAPRIDLEKDLVLNLNNHSITFSGWGFRVSGSKLTLDGGTITAGEACAYALNAGTIIVKGGTYNSADNYVIGTHGSIGSNNTIVIDGGVFYGGIISQGYVACGVYVANNDEVRINAGTFNITNGVGILARSGNTTVGENVLLNVSGNGTVGKIGDSRVVLPSGAELVLDYAANYPGGVPQLTNNSNYDVYYVLGDMEIKTEADLIAFRNAVNAGNDFAGKKITLEADIALTSGWTPIGEGSRKLGDVALVGYPTYFRGEFDGNNHTISGLTNAGFTPSEGRIVSGQYAYGLFALVGNGAYFHDLTLAGVAINTTTYQGAIGDSVGALVGYSIGNITVDHITVSGTVKASESVGGIIGRSICDSASVEGPQTVRVTNCTNNATVIGYGSDDNAVKASGIVGYTAIYVNTIGSIVLTNNTNNGAVSVTNTYTGNNTYKAIAAGIACYGQGTANSATGSVTITGNTNTASVNGTAAVVMTDPIAQLCWTSFKSENTTIANNTYNAQ